MLILNPVIAERRGALGTYRRLPKLRAGESLFTQPDKTIDTDAEIAEKLAYLLTTVNAQLTDDDDLAADGWPRKIQHGDMLTEPGKKRPRQKIDRVDTGETFTCRGCHATKPLTEFHVDKSMTRGHKSRCMECCNQHSRATYRNKAKPSQLARMSTEDVRVYEWLYWSR